MQSTRKVSIYITVALGFHTNNYCRKISTEATTGTPSVITKLDEYSSYQIYNLQLGGASAIKEQLQISDVPAEASSLDPIIVSTEEKEKILSSYLDRIKSRFVLNHFTHFTSETAHLLTSLQDALCSVPLVSNQTGS
jgi:hypothetical protein